MSRTLDAARGEQTRFFVLAEYLAEQHAASPASPAT